jgi:hypothetical protein
MGGSNEFATEDASKTYNNDLGSSVDAPFMNLLPLAIMRHQLKIPARSGEIPPIVLSARSLDNGEPYRISIDVKGNVDYEPRPVVITDTKPKYTERLVAGSPEKVAEILTGMLKKAKEKGETIFSLQGQTITSAADIPGVASVEETTLFKASIVAIDGDIWARGIFKIILGLGHILLGPNWTFAADGGDRIRAVVCCDRIHWPIQSFQRVNVGKLSDDISKKLGITDIIRKQYIHTVAVLPTETDLGMEYVAIVSLFGGMVPETMISLGPQAGFLASPNESMKTQKRMGARINPVSRQVTWITAGEIDANH